MSKLLDKKSNKDIQKASSSQILNPFEEMEKMFEEFSTRGWLRPFHWESPIFREFSSSLEQKIPSVDVIENDDKITVRAEMPGIEKKDLNISVMNNSVTIKGSSSHEEKKEEGDYYHCEIAKGAYLRTVALPAEVDEEKAKASFKDGVLELVLPKVEKSHRKNIKVD